MENTYFFDSISSYNNYNNQETLHPLVSVIDFSKANSRKGAKMHFGIYCIFMKEIHCGDLKYGCKHYDYEAGTLVFLSPGQVIDVANKTTYYQPMGYGLVFHKDLLIGTSLGKLLKDYHFFQYHTKEALHLSEQERSLIIDSLRHIKEELQYPIDKHSKKLIASNIELFLNYCQRFYDRQFITRSIENTGILERFEQLLIAYFTSRELTLHGLPTVAHFAEKLHLSSNYFGDLIKKETGKSPTAYIQQYLIEQAKLKMSHSDQSIQEIAYEMGFKYPQHFSRLFKNIVGISPKDFRQKINSY